MNTTMDQPCSPGRFVLGQIVRWTARLCSLPLIYFLGCGLVGTFQNGGSVPARDILDFIFFPAGVTLGLILAWRWEALGAAMILVGIVEVYISFMLSRGQWAGGVFSLLGAPGLLFLLSRMLNGHRHTGRGTQPSTNAES